MKLVKIFFTALCLFFIATTVTSQRSKPESLLNKYAQVLPLEKLHFHFDKEIYLPGETIWFKAYLYGDGVPSQQSTNLYTALYNESGQLIQKLLLPVFGSSASGSFQVPDTIKGNAVFCRAYTTWMLNFDEDFLFTKAIKILNSGSVAAPDHQNNISLVFFAEGGDIVEGLANSVAFKATDSRGLPFNVNGTIKNKKTGAAELNFSATHNGMGRFNLIAEEGATYVAEWTDAAGNSQQTMLPAPVKSGISLKTALQDDKVIFNVTSVMAADSFLIMLYQHQQVVYSKTVYLEQGVPFTEMIASKNLVAGTAQLTVFSTSVQPLAERVFFIKNSHSNAIASINIKESSLQKRAKNILEVMAADTVLSNMSLSITDADMNDGANINIESSLLLSGDVKGYIHNPAYYFSGDKDAAANLDLVMLTNGWRRYNWMAMQNGVQPLIKYPADNYLQIQGQIGKEALRLLPADEQVKLVVKTKDSTQKFYLIKPDNTGLIKSDGLVFYDTASVYYSFKKNKNASTQIALGNTNYTYQIPAAVLIAQNYKTALQTAVTVKPVTELYKYYSAQQSGQGFNKEKTLESVVVKTGGWNNWKNNPLVKLEERYATGVFRGGAAGDGLDVLHDDKAWTKGDIYNYINGKIPAIQVISSGGGKSLSSLDAVSGFGASARPMMLFIDESEVDNYQLSLINIENVAYIKYVPRYPGVQGLPPALSIYLKKGADLNIASRGNESNQKMQRIPGYSPVKEFYAPDYSQNNTTTGTDARTTLLWLPYLLTDKANPKQAITFYTGDFTKRVRIVLEGMNDEGKLIHIEKIIE